MPPSAAPEWLRTGWIFEMTATSAPMSNASIAARMPAQPAPTTTTSYFASTTWTLSDGASGALRLRDWPGGRDRFPGRLRELLEVLAEHRGELGRLPVVRVRVGP